MRKLLIITAMAFLTSACSITTHYVQTGAQVYPATNPSSIKVYANKKVYKNYTVIGSVASHTPGDGNKATAALKEEAAKIGANAIIAFKLDKINSVANVTEASGTAVRINK